MSSGTMAAETTSLCIQHLSPTYARLDRTSDTILLQVRHAAQQMPSPGDLHVTKHRLHDVMHSRCFLDIGLSGQCTTRRICGCPPETDQEAGRSPTHLLDSMQLACRNREASILLIAGFKRFYAVMAFTLDRTQSDNISLSNETSISKRNHQYPASIPRTSIATPHLRVANWTPWFLYMSRVFLPAVTSTTLIGA
ncbi:hypothetical protein IQ06DRAFT_110449 [Phaeosphaeriaceae sp. SRC1lsM3a]|nr:hypothetical protein IQ06DRAFT_110449 [Stagonospora sp. SRC1lsM3a]